MNNLSSLPPEIAPARIAPKSEEAVPLPDQALATDSPKPFDSHLPRLGEKRALRQEEKENADKKEKAGIDAGSATIAVGFVAPPLPSPLTPSVPFELKAEITSTFAPISPEQVDGAGNGATSPGATLNPDDRFAKAEPSPQNQATKSPSVSSLPNEQPTSTVLPSLAAASTASASTTPDPVNVPVASANAPEAIGPAIQNLEKPVTPVPRPAKSSDGARAGRIEVSATKENTDNSSSEETFAVPPPRGGGTDAAKHQVAMPSAEPESQPKSKLFTTTARAETIVSPAPRVASSSASQDFLPGERQSDSNSFSQPGAADAAWPSSANGPISASHSVEPPQKTAHTEQVTHLFHAISEATEKLQSDGRTNVEMQINLRDGAQLTVRLQMHGGEVRAIFKTDSTEWREAIARGWSDFSSNSAERGLRVTTPIFQSPAAQPGLNDFNNQRHDRREEAESTAGGHSLLPPTPPKNRTPPTGTPTSSPSHPASHSAASLAAWA
jgi:hypothetical protein